MNESKHRVANLAFFSQIFVEILAFFKALEFFFIFKKFFFQSESLGSGKTLSELHTHYESL